MTSRNGLRAARTATWAVALGSVLAVLLPAPPAAAVPVIEASMELVSDTDPVRVGDEFSYRMTLSNTGDQDDTEVFMGWSVPEGVDFVQGLLGPVEDALGPVEDGVDARAAAFDADCDYLAESLNFTCNFASLPAGSDTIVDAVVTATAAGEVNTSFSGGSQNGGSSFGEVTHTIEEALPVIDIEVDKTGTDETIVEGELRRIKFTVVVRNASPPATGTAGGVVVTDLLGDGFTHLPDPAVTSKGSYSKSTGIWTVGDLAPGESATLVFRVEVAPTGSHRNCAHASAYAGDDPDSQPANFNAMAGPQEDDEDCFTIDEIDIEVTKSFQQVASGLGGFPPPPRVEFTVQATNAAHASVTATGVEVTDLLPDGLTYVSADPDPDYDESTGIWLVGDLAVGETKTLTVVADITDPDGPVTNCAAATDYDGSLDADSNPGPVVGGVPDEDDEACVELRNDISVQKVLTGADSLAYDFEITVTNADDATFESGPLFVQDHLAPGLSYRSGSASATQGAFFPGGMEWDVGSLAPGASATLTLAAELDDDGVIDAVIANCAEASGYADLDEDSGPGFKPALLTAFPPMEDDEACVDDTIDVALDVDVAFDGVGGGVRQVDLTYLVTNEAPAATSHAFDIEVQDGHPLLAPALTYVAHAGDGTYTPGSGTWEIADLAPGESAELVVTFDVERQGPFTRCASATAYNDSGLDADSDSDEGIFPFFVLDPTPTEDDEDCVTLDEVDVEVTKVASDQFPLIGTTVTFSLTATNVAPVATVDATGVEVWDDLPVGLSFLSASPSADYDDATGVWDVGDLAPDEQRTLHITARVDEAGEFFNCAEAGDYDDDLDFDSSRGNLTGTAAAEDDEACELVTAMGVSTTDLEVTKSASPASVAPGGTTTYTVTVTNTEEADGPARDVEVVDHLPTGVTLLGVEASGETSFVAGTGTWDAGRLFPGDTETLELLVRFDTAGTHRNCAEVDAAVMLEIDSTPGNLDLDTLEPVEDDEACAEVTATAPATGGGEDGTTTTTTPAPPPRRTTVVTAPARPPAGPRPSITVETDAGDVTVSVELVEDEDEDESTGDRPPVEVRVTATPVGEAGANTRGFRVLDQAFEVEVTGGTPTRVELCFPYSPAAAAAAGIAEENLELFHFDSNGQRQVVTTTVDTVNHRVCGATSSLSPFAIGQLATTRLAGADAVSTAAALSAATFEPGVAVVHVADRRAWSDAVAGGAAAAAAGGSLLLVDDAGVPASTAAELTRLQPGRIVVVGGTAAVADRVVEQLAAIAPTARLAGADRYATSAAISAAAHPSGASVVYVASGVSSADVVVAGASAARAGAPVLLVAPDRVPEVTRDELERLAPARIVVVGGTAAVGETVVARLSTVGTVTRLAGADRYATAAAVAVQLPTGSAILVARGTDPADGLVAMAAAPSRDAGVLLVPPSGVPAAVAVALDAVQPGSIAIIGGTAAVPRATEVELAASLPET